MRKLFRAAYNGRQPFPPFFFRRSSRLTPQSVSTNQKDLPHARHPEVMDLASRHLVLFLRSLGWVGTEIYLNAPPIPKQVIGSKGEVLFTADRVERGQSALAGRRRSQLGGLGSRQLSGAGLVCDWLHREAVTLRDIWAGASLAPAIRSCSQPAGPARYKPRAEMRHNNTMRTPA